jgi:hypothetical protein
MESKTIKSVPRKNRSCNNQLNLSLQLLFIRSVLSVETRLEGISDKVDSMQINSKSKNILIQDLLGNIDTMNAKVYR